MSDNLIGATTAIFIVSLSIAVNEPVDVAWSTRDGTAKAGTDYKAANGVVSFLPGETRKQIEVTVYGQNVSPTGDKNFFINLMPPTNAVLGTTLIEAVIKVEDEAGVPVTSVIVAQGKRGLKGDPGLSAYEQAVLMGYDGTLEDWMQEQADAAAAAQRASDYAANAAAAAAKAENAATAASFLGNIFPTPEAGVDPVTGVGNGAYYNVRSTEDDSYLVEYQNIGGVPTPTGKSFPSSAALSKSINDVAEVKEAIIDPITGLATTSTLFDKNLDKYQEAVNSEQLTKTYSLRDAGGVGGGANDTAAFNAALAQNPRLYLNTDQSIIDQGVIKKFVNLYGEAELIQPNINRPTLYFGWQTGDPEFNTGAFVEKPIVTSVRFGMMGLATSDDYAALTFSNVDAPINCFSHYRETENGTRLSTVGGTYGKTGYGTRDALIFGNTYFHARRFAVQILQASYSKIIGITSHNNGDNTFNNTGAGENDGGKNVGVRLAGLGKGNIIGLSNFRDKYFGVTLQRGSEYNIVADTYFENSLSNAITNSASSLPAGLRNIVADVVVNKSGGEGIRALYTGNSRYSGTVSETANLGLNADAHTVGNNSFIIYFSNGSGSIPPINSTISQGAVTCKVIAIRNEALSAVTSGAMPSKGTLIVNTVAGGNLQNGVAFTGVSATIDRVIAGEGRNRIDLTITESMSNSARIQTDCNLVDLISSSCNTDDMILAGNYNIVRIAQSETKEGRYSRVTGSYNIVILTDNEQSTAETTLSITGSNNIVLGATKGRIALSGNNNFLNVITERVVVSGNDNDVGGQIVQVTDTGSNNKFSRIKNGSKTGTATLTTDENGQVTLIHALAGTAKYIEAKSTVLDTLFHFTVANIANSATSAKLQVWNANGTKATSGVSVSFSYFVSI